MSYNIDLSKLLKEQYNLDKAIQDNHHISYGETVEERKLALLVELGEFANTTRSFKFWSNKGLDSKERILDEAADCLHFYLSLFITNLYKIYGEANLTKCFSLSGMMNEPYKASKKEITSLFIGAIKKASNENANINDIIKDSFNSYEECSFDYYLNIIAGLGYSWQDLEEAYYKKLGVNYQRQENNY